MHMAKKVTEKNMSISRYSGLQNPGIKLYSSRQTGKSVHYWQVWVEYGDCLKFCPSAAPKGASGLVLWECAALFQGVRC